MLLGCIGDDFTGSSDLANTLAKGGMRVVQYNGVPSVAAKPNVEAGVVALKSRTAPVAEAVSQSLSALRWLEDQGCKQFLFKYCSTFDSTPDGNIGPVLDALSEALGGVRAVVCPAFPATGRSIYMGHLFVDDRLLSESGMQDHPLTPMTDPDIRRWLGRQSSNKVGHVPHSLVAEGATAIKAALEAEAAAARTFIVVDAISSGDLSSIGKAIADDLLVSGGSGIALGLPENFLVKGLLSNAVQDWRGQDGAIAVLSGSCSRATRSQIEHHSHDHPVRKIVADEILQGRLTANDIASWVMSTQDNGKVPLVFSSANPEDVASAYERFGREQVSSTIESFFAETARLLVRSGLRRLITAGGETSGAVVAGLNISEFEIGPEIDAGVPALSVPGRDLVLSLKSGNFGGPDFFARAASLLGSRGDHASS